MALVKLRAQLRAEGGRQITQSDRRTNEQAVAVARGQEQLPPFIAAGTFRWQEIRRAYEQTADALDSTGQADDRELAKDVRTFLDKHQGMNATPEVFAAQHALILAATRTKPEPPAPKRYADAAWLVRKFAVSLVPSIEGFRALRAAARAKPAPQAFIGMLQGKNEGKQLVQLSEL